MRETAPNILLITTDQQRFDTISALGNQSIDTPHLDWLVDEGITCTRAYADCPVCMPSRATIMTGLSGTSLGQTSNTSGVSPMEGHSTLPQVLGARGYQTHAQGKMHFEPMRARYGFQSMELPMDYYRQRHRESTGPMGLPKQHGLGENEMFPVIATVHENESLTHWTVDRSINFLETRDPRHPFFLWTSFTKPHPPFDPPAHYWALYANRDIPPPAWGEWSQTVEDMPQGFLEPTYLLNSAHRMSPQQLENSRRAYYACITHVDHALGRLFARLRETGLLETTWIIFTSDHGENLGDHHMGGKSNFLEGSAHVPLVIRPPADPWKEKPLAGRRVDTLVTLADIMPTILARGKATPGSSRGTDGSVASCGTALAEPRAESCDGADILKFLDHRDASRVVVGECGTFAALITARYSYHYCARGGEELLFDHEDDPRQSRNLAGRQEHASRVRDMRRDLAENLRSRGSALVEGDGAPALCRMPPIAGPGDVVRWPGFHSTSVDSDVLH